MCISPADSDGFLCIVKHFKSQTSRYFIIFLALHQRSQEWQQDTIHLQFPDWTDEKIRLRKVRDAGSVLNSRAASILGFLISPLSFLRVRYGPEEKKTQIK